MFKFGVLLVFMFVCTACFMFIFSTFVFNLCTACGLGLCVLLIFMFVCTDCVFVCVN